MKDINNLKGLNRTRTIGSIKKRSMPRIQTSTYLDLFMLDKERVRLEKEVAIMDRRNNTIQKRMEEIKGEMNMLLKPGTPCNAGANANSFKQSLERKDRDKKEWKKMSLNY